MEIYKPKSEQWFADRIGKRIFRNHYECCADCINVDKNGLIVNDKDHANYLACIDNDFASEGRLLNYRDEK